MELAKNDIADDFLRRAEEHINAALRLDYSTAKKKLNVEPDENEDPGYYQRPYERMMKILQDKLLNRRIMSKKLLWKWKVSKILKVLTLK